MPSSSAPPPRLPPNAVVPAGMLAKTVTTTYSDGRQVTTTEYQQPGASSSTGARPLALVAPSPAASQYHPPREDLGTRPASITCPYCTSTVSTRTKHNCGDCTLMSVIILLLLIWPLFWIPFICPDVSVSHILSISLMLTAHFECLTWLLSISYLRWIKSWTLCLVSRC